MKSFLLLIATLAGLSTAARAQAPRPDCTNLLVDSVGIADTTLRVVLSNICDSCSSHIDGAVYLEMTVVRRSNIQDTISRSACYCFMTPVNNGQFAYILPLPTSALPPASDLRVSLYNLCDDIPFRSASTGVRPVVAPVARISYDWLVRRVTVSGLDGVTTFHIVDASGRVVVGGRTDESRFFIDASAWPPGAYGVELLTAQGRTTEKLLVR